MASISSDEFLDMPTSAEKPPPPSFFFIFCEEEQDLLNTYPIHIIIVSQPRFGVTIYMTDQWIEKVRWEAVPFIFIIHKTSSVLTLYKIITGDYLPCLLLESFRARSFYVHLNALIVFLVWINSRFDTYMYIHPIYSLVDRSC